MEGTKSREDDRSGVAVVANPLFGEQPECWNFQFRHAVQSLKTTSWGLPRSSAAQVISAVRLMSDMGVPKLLLWHMTPGVVVEDATEVLDQPRHQAEAVGYPMERITANLHDYGLFESFPVEKSKESKLAMMTFN